MSKYRICRKFPIRQIPTDVSNTLDMYDMSNILGISKKSTNMKDMSYMYVEYVGQVR